MHQYMDGVEVTCFIKKEVESIVNGAKSSQFCCLMDHHKCGTNCTWCKKGVVLVVTAQKTVIAPSCMSWLYRPWLPGAQVYVIEGL
jgi:hypothetical protein